MNKQPNVIVFFTDQQRWDTMAAHGNPLNLTPNLDRIAQENTFLANSFTCQPVCGPARSCLQTGLYATQTGCYRNAIPLAHDHETLAQHFNKAGYATGYIGKWHLAPRKFLGAVPEEHRGGYDYWLAANALEHTSDAYNCTVYNNENEAVKLPGYRVDALTDAAIRYVDQQKEDPFFLFLSYLEPHHQNHSDDYPAPTGYREDFTSRWTPPDLAALGGTAPQHLGGYYGMVKRIDEAYGRLIDALQSMGQLDNTIILFTSDHACHFKTRNGEYKRSCHESSIHVPTVISGPGFENGGHIKSLVNLVDLIPTILEAAAIQPPESLPGRSILPLLKNPKTPWPEDVFVQISETEHGRCLRTKRWKYSVTSPYDDSRDHSDTYTEAFLYDLDADPYELTNLIGYASHREIADQLKQRLLEYIALIENKQPTICNAVDKDAGQRALTIRIESKNYDKPQIT